METKFYTVYDKGRQIDFEGSLLGSSSSFSKEKPRWFVVEIYKTAGGKYIVAGSGKSRVVHRENCTQLKDKGGAPQDAKTGSFPCESCRPDLTQPVVHETNREWAQVSDDPNAIIERLRLRDSDGVMYLPKTSTNAILQAAGNDEGVKRAFYAPQRVE